LPPDPIETTPCVGCVTEETVAPAFSKLSFVSTLNVCETSSVTVTLSVAISTTGATVIATALTAAGAKPSDVETLSVVAPFQSAVGANASPLSAAVIALALPVMVTVPVPFPVTETPVMEPSVSEPFATVKVVVTVLSTSAMVIALPLAALNTRLASSFVDWSPGTVLTGASLTAATVTVTVAVSCTPPDVTV